MTVAVALAVAAALAAPSPVDALVAEAVARDPEVALAEAALLAARGAHQAAAFLRANPTVDAAVGFGVPQVDLQLTQPVSVTGEGQAARREASSQVAAAAAGLARARLEAAAEVRLVLCDVAAGDRDAELARAAVARARDVREAVEARVEAGDAPEVDAQLARLTEAAAVGEWLAASRARDRARIALGTATGLGSAAEAGLSDPLDAAPAESVAETARTDVAAARAEADAARAGVQRAAAGAVPPVGLGLWVQAQDVGATIGPTLTVEIPVWHRNDLARARAEGDRSAADARSVAVQAEAEAEQRVHAARRAEIDAVVQAMPALRPDDADGAAASIREAYVEGQLSGLEVTLWLDRIGAAERAVIAARREAAAQRIEQALAEEWPTLLGAGP